MHSGLKETHDVDVGYFRCDGLPRRYDASMEYDDGHTSILVVSRLVSTAKHL